MPRGGKDPARRPGKSPGSALNAGPANSVLGLWDDWRALDLLRPAGALRPIRRQKMQSVV